MMYIVLLEEHGSLGRYEIPGNSEGVCETHKTLSQAADHVAWLENTWDGLYKGKYSIYRLNPRISDVPIERARKRAGVADSAEHKPVPPSAYEKIAALIVSELRDLEGEEQVSREVYEDLVIQNQALTEKIGDLEETNRMLSAEPDKWRKAHYAKCLELEAELDRVDQIRKALDAD